MSNKHVATNDERSELVIAHDRIKRLYREVCEDLDKYDETTHINVPLTRPQLSALLEVTTRVVER